MFLTKNKMIFREELILVFNENETLNAIDLILKWYDVNPSDKVGVIFHSLRSARQFTEKLKTKSPIIDILREVDRYSIHGSNFVFCSIENGTKIRGLRFNKLIICNYEMIPKDILDDVVRGYMVYSKSPVDLLKDCNDNN